MARNNAYIQQYKKDHYGRVNLWLTKEEKAKWQEAAKKEGLTLTEWVKKKVNGPGN